MWIVTRNALIVFGTVIGAGWTVANIVGLYYAKVYLFDQPALNPTMRAEQIGTHDAYKHVVITVSFDNHGIRPYEIPLKDIRPITIAKVARNEQNEPTYEITKQVSLKGVFPTNDKSKPMQVRDMVSLVFDPGEKGTYSALALLPEAGLYFLEFSVQAPYRSLFLDHILRKPDDPIWLITNAYVHVQ